jgi:hypothetical protein
VSTTVVEQRDCRDGRFVGLVDQRAGKVVRLAHDPSVQNLARVDVAALA